MAVTGRAIEVITGPTTSGKSALALDRAAHDPAIEIVNADAFQIYRGFDIGTAKPSAEEQQQVRHHLIDILAPQESYSAGQYARDARRVIEEIIARDATPLVAGGTGLYVDALFYGISSINLDEQAEREAKEKYRIEFEEQGFEKLHERLKPIDPDLYQQIAREKNPIRLERAWVHFHATGIPLGQARKIQPEPFGYPPKFTLLLPEREELRLKIARRIDAMLAAGWLNEVRDLLNRRVTREAPAMRAIGYLELADVVEEKVIIEQARELIITKTRQYAKRQMTWMKRYARH